MGCEAGQCKTSTPYGIFIVTPSFQGWPTKTKEAPSPSYVYIYIYIYIHIYMVFITDGFFEVAIESFLSGIWTHGHWIPFWCSNWLSYQAMSSTHTQIQCSTATPVLSFVQCHISFWLFIVSHHISLWCVYIYIYIYIFPKQYGNVLVLYINLFKNTFCFANILSF